MHAHRCPACMKDFEHERFEYVRTWNHLERIVARAIHRFAGACNPCVEHFIESGFHQDPDIQKLRTVQGDGRVLFTAAANPKVGL